ncbi:MAG: CoA transferase [Rhodothermales bacterium]|nr:CoA transferase [Rhodothermales bacterium]MBO6780428.1 CoA transferase [Rhodothermales bacterium]
MLEGLLVVELATVLAGPSVGQFLAELGARVVKVEPPAGDVTRSWHRAAENPDDTASYFSAANFGKESVVLDLRDTEAARAAKALAARADILIASFRPGHDARLGLDPETLLLENPGLIVATVSGYGRDSDRAGYDAVIQAESGFMAMNGYPDRPPVKLPVALMDVLAAHHLKEGILLALLDRQRTGKGRHVTISLLDAAVSALANQGSGTLRTGQPPVRMGSAHPNIAPYGTVLQCSDGESILLAVGSSRQFEAVCEALHVPVDAQWRTNAGRVRQRQQLESRLQAAAAGVASDTLMAGLEKCGVPAGRIRHAGDALARSPYMVLEPEGIRQWPAGFRELSPPPDLGAHTELVLAELTDLGGAAIARIIALNTPDA